MCVYEKGGIWKSWNSLITQLCQYRVFSGVYSHPTPPLWAWGGTRSVFKQSKAGLNSVFVLIDGLSNQVKRTQSALFTSSWGLRRKWIHVFSRALAQSEMRIVLSRIWTWIANSISDDDNHYLKHTSSPNRRLWELAVEGASGGTWPNSKNYAETRTVESYVSQLK